jgi:carboxyl-terminal processing protease
MRCAIEWRDSVLHRVISCWLFVALAGTPALTLASGEAPDEIIRTAIAAVDSHYLYSRSNPQWDKAKEHLLRATYKTSGEVYRALDREIATLGDSELNVLSTRQLAELQEDVAGEGTGIGLVAFAIDSDRSGYARIVTPIFGTPAAEAGVRAGDIIERVNGRLTNAMTHEQVIDELRGESAAGDIALNLRRGQRRIRLMLHATQAKLTPVHVEAVKRQGRVIGYIRIVQFTPESGQQVRLAVAKFERDSVSAYIIDLRNNPGGLLDAAVAAASAFTHGPYGVSIQLDGEPRRLESKEPVLTSRPISVLTNRGTASAAEVLTAALSDNARATVVGATSYGRAQAQTYYPLTDGYGIALPSARVQGPMRKGIEGSGRKPDVEIVEDPPTLRTVATQDDAAFVRALDILNAAPS